MAKTLVDMDEEELAKELGWMLAGFPDGTSRVAAIIRKMIEHSLQENGVKSND